MHEDIYDCPEVEEVYNEDRWYNDFDEEEVDAVIFDLDESTKTEDPCPTCGESNVLTLLDIRLGYQCDSCASRRAA